jgi:hypothetical protein
MYPGNASRIMAQFIASLTAPLLKRNPTMARTELRESLTLDLQLDAQGAAAGT